MDDQEEVPDIKAWVCALRTLGHAESHEVLVKYVGRALCVANSSTSPLERDFGNLTVTFQKRVSRPLLKEMHVRVSSFLKKEPGVQSHVVKRAQNVWREGFNPGRRSGEQRSGNFVSGNLLAKKRKVTGRKLSSLVIDFGTLNLQISSA